MFNKRTWLSIGAGVDLLGGEISIVKYTKGTAYLMNAEKAILETIHSNK